MVQDIKNLLIKYHQMIQEKQNDVLERKMKKRLNWKIPQKKMKQLS
jgi:hypothetical protein